MDILLDSAKVNFRGHHSDDPNGAFLYILVSPIAKRCQLTRPWFFRVPDMKAKLSQDWAKMEEETLSRHGGKKNHQSSWYRNQRIGSAVFVYVAIKSIGWSTYNLSISTPHLKSA